MVFLGFGKYARADKIYALEPLRATSAAAAAARASGSRASPSRSSPAGPSGRSCTRWARTPRDGKPLLDEALALAAADRRGRRQGQGRPRRPQPAGEAPARATASPDEPTSSSELTSRETSSPAESPGAAAPAAVGRARARHAAAPRPQAFRRLWFGQAISFFGSEITAVAIPYQMYQLTGSTLAVGLLALCDARAAADAAAGRRRDRGRGRPPAPAALHRGRLVALVSALLAVNAPLPQPRVWALFVARRRRHVRSSASGSPAHALADAAARRRGPARRGDRAEQRLLTTSPPWPGPRSAACYRRRRAHRRLRSSTSARSPRRSRRIWLPAAVPAARRTPSAPACARCVEGFRFVRGRSG